MLTSQARADFPTSFDQALERLNGRTSRRLRGVDTYLVLNGGLIDPASDPLARISVVYHNTCVVTFYHNGDVMLNTGGWQTNTTKERMNMCLPSYWFVFQKNWTWYLHAPFGDMPWRGRRILLTGSGNARGAVAEGTPLAMSERYAPYFA